MFDHKSIIPLVPIEISGLSEKTDLSLEEKKASHQIIKQFVNENTKDIISPSDILKDDGCLYVGKLLDADKTKEELYRFPIYKGHIKNDLYSDEMEITSYLHRDLLNGIYCWSMQDLLKCKTITDVASNPLIIDFVSRYLGCLPTCYGINCMLSVGTSGHGTTSRHRDLDEFKFVSLFVYLDDVGMSNGAHVYEMGTHLGNKGGKKGNEVPQEPQRSKIFTGKAGEGFIEDNWGVHHGMTLRPEAKRTCLWVRYGLYDNYTSRHSVHIDKQRTSEHTIDTSSKINQYVFRFLI